MDTALAMLDRFGFDRFHLIGHSMGGLTALMLAQRCPERVLSFVDIEGNIAPEDCFLSRQIVTYADDDAGRFLMSSSGAPTRRRRGPARCMLPACGIR